MNTLEEVALWQQKCGNEPPKVGSDLYWEMLQNQVDRIKEEANEVQEAINNRDLDNLLKEVCDLEVVTAGAAYLHGGNHEGAMAEVLGNNDLKVTTERVKATIWALYHSEEGEVCYVSSSRVKGTEWHCVKRLVDNKILKPPQLPKVSLLGFIPKEV